MKNFIIENDILKAYLGCEKTVVVPCNVKQIGGVLDEKDEHRKELIGDPIGYKAFFCNNNIEELYLPDSVSIIGFKSIEHCHNLRILSFSNNLKEVEINGLLCCNIKRILFRGTIFEMSLLSLKGNLLDIDEIICTDGVIRYHQDYYVNTLYFPGKRNEWEHLEEISAYQEALWLKRRAKHVICIDD